MPAGFTRLYFLFLNFIILQGLALTNLRHSRQQSGTLQSSRLNSYFNGAERFATLYNGKSWAEVTHLPRGWDIIDFGPPKPKKSMRFRQLRRDYTGVGQVGLFGLDGEQAEDTDDELNLGNGEELGNLHCSEGGNGEIECKPLPQDKDPDHGVGTDVKEKKESDNQKKSSLDEQVSSKDWQSTLDQATNNEKIPQPQADHSVKAEQIQQPQTDDKQSQTDGKQSQTDGKQSQTDGKQTAENTSPAPKKIPETKPEPQNFVIGGGYVVTLEVRWYTCMPRAQISGSKKCEC